MELHSPFLPELPWLKGLSVTGPWTREETEAQHSDRTVVGFRQTLGKA